MNEKKVPKKEKRVKTNTKEYRSKDKNRQINDEKVYDSVFWTAANTLASYLPMLVNEAFGEHFTKNAKVEYQSNKETIEVESGRLAERNMDAMFKLSEQLDQFVEKNYHFECEILGRKKVAIRIAEYACGYAFNNVSMTEDGASVEIPHSAVIFLRSNSTNVSSLKIVLNYPGGKAYYYVPVLKITDYDLDDLFEKKLLLLVPFSVFKISDKELEYMENTGDASKIEEMLTDINKRLSHMVDKGELEYRQKADIIRYTGMVLEKLTFKFGNVGREVKRIMGGVIFKTDVDEAWENGVEKGMEKGMEKGRISEFISIRKEDGYSDRRIIKNLAKRFDMTLEAAKNALAEFVSGSQQTGTL